MSLNHIIKNGLKDISLDVKDLNCDSITVNNLPIESFDQDLNTTDDVRFNKLTLTSTMFTDPNQAVNKDYVDNSAPGTGSLQSAYNGGNTILTAVGFPIELTGTDGLNLNSNPITTGKLTFPNPQELISRQYVDDAISSIPSSTTLQDAYDNGNTIITTPGNNVEIQGALDASFVNTTQLSSSSNLTIGVSSQAQILAQSLLLTTPQVTISGQTSTQQTSFSDPQNLVTKNYVDTAISAIPPPTITTSLQDAYDNGSGQIALTISKPLELIGNEGLLVNNNPVLTTKLTFNDPNEFVSRQYIDDAIAQNGNIVFDWTANTSPGSVNLDFAGSTTYVTNANNFFLNITNNTFQEGYVNFDAGQAYDNFKFEVYYKILNTTTPGDILGFFACGTQVNSGDINATGGLTFDTDYFAGGSFNSEGRITDGTGGIITPYQLRGYNDFNQGATSNKMTMTRTGQNVTIEIEGTFGRYSRTVTNFTPTFTGTRFGIYCKTGGVVLNCEIGSVKLTTF